MGSPPSLLAAATSVVYPPQESCTCHVAAPSWCELALLCLPVAHVASQSNSLQQRDGRSTFLKTPGHRKQNLLQSNKWSHLRENYFTVLNRLEGVVLERFLASPLFFFFFVVIARCICYCEYNHARPEAAIKTYTKNYGLFPVPNNIVSSVI